MAFSLGDIKKFLKSDAAASMARQALGIPADGNSEDHEVGHALGTTGGPTDIPANIPAPVRTVTTTPQQPAIAAPLPTVPPPTRVTMDTPPPSGPQPAYINNMEAVNQNLRVPGNLSEATGDALTGFKGATFNPVNPEIPAPNRTVTPVDPVPMPTGTAIPAPHRVFMGERTGTVDDSGNLRPALTPAEKAAAHVKALEADPSQSVKETPEGYEVGPPHKMSRLKAMGKMFLQRMMAGSQYGLGGMLGAGLEGAIEGGVAPGHAQKVFRQAEREQAQNDQYQAQTLEGRQNANELEKLRIGQETQTAIDAPKRRQQQEKELASQEYNRDVDNLRQLSGQLKDVAADSPEYASGLQALQTEAERLSQKHGFKVSVIPGEGRRPARIVVEGEVLRENPDGSLKSIYGSPKTDNTDTNHNQDTQYAWEKTRAESQAKRAASQQAAQAAEDEAKNYQQKIDASSAALSTLDAQLGAEPATVPDKEARAAAKKKNEKDETPYVMPNPKLGSLRRQRATLAAELARHETARDAAYRKQKEHQAKAAEFVDPPPPPTRGKQTAGAGKVLPRANLAEAAARLVKQGAIKDASQAEAYLRGQGVTVQ